MPTEREKDDFWDLSKLLPQKKSTSMTRFAPDTSLPTVETAGEAPKPRTENTLSFGKREEKIEEVVTYKPESNPLITAVMVERRSASYSFYARFRTEGLRRLSFFGEECEYTPFFSYIPQYSQLSAAQAAYYYYFRRMTKEGKKLRADFSYFLLLVYEILNLPDAIPPTEGLETLVFLWRTYREDFPKADKYLAEWIPDYCLLHKLPCPTKALSPFLSAVLSAASFKEFYLGNASELTPEGIDALLALASSYHWRHSRYATGDNLPLYETHIYGALLPVARRLFSQEDIGATADARERVYEAFSGSLCSHNIRATLHVMYHPFAHTPTLQRVLTQAVKYADNKLRAMLSIKNRCTVAELPYEYRHMIDEYFARVARANMPTPKREAYEALYDADSTGISVSAAAEIELRSWDNTRALVPEEEYDEDAALLAETVSTPMEASSHAAREEDTGDRYGLSDTAYAFLLAIYNGDKHGAECLAASVFTACDTLAEEVNMAWSDSFGDVILEYTDDGYAVIEDYKDEVERWIEETK